MRSLGSSVVPCGPSPSRLDALLINSTIPGPGRELRGHKEVTARRPEGALNGNQSRRGTTTKLRKPGSTRVIAFGRNRLRQVSPEFKSPCDTAKALVRAASGFDWRLSASEMLTGGVEESAGHQCRRRIVQRDGDVGVDAQRHGDARVAASGFTALRHRDRLPLLSLGGFDVADFQ